MPVHIGDVLPICRPTPCLEFSRDTVNPIVGPVEKIFTGFTSSNKCDPDINEQLTNHWEPCCHWGRTQCFLNSLYLGHCTPVQTA